MIANGSIELGTVIEITPEGMGVSYGIAIVLLFPFITFPQLTAPQIISNTEIDRGVVRLDGRRLFTIAVPALRDRPNGTPIDTRVQNIETSLTQLAERNLDPSPPQVTAGILLSTYLVIRLSNVAIDRFFSAVSGSSDSVQASQRIALRVVSTFAALLEVYLLLSTFVFGCGLRPSRCNNGR